MGGCHPLSGNVTRVVRLSRVIIIIFISKVVVVVVPYARVTTVTTQNRSHVSAPARVRPRAPTRGCAGARPGNRRFVVTHGNRRDFVETAPTYAAAGLMQQRGSTK